MRLCWGLRRIANEKWEQLRRAEQEIDAAVAEAKKLEQEKEQKVARLKLCQHTATLLAVHSGACCKHP